MSSLQRGILYGLLAAAIWGGMYVVSDGVLRVIPPFTLLTIRLLLGVVTLALLLQLRRRSAAQTSTNLSPQSCTSASSPPTSATVTAGRIIA